MIHYKRHSVGSHVRIPTNSDAPIHGRHFHSRYHENILLPSSGFAPIRSGSHSGHFQSQKLSQLTQPFELVGPPGGPVAPG